MIVGLAGHIDHGKSALATALSGRPMDRLADEQRRGITIELNFAPMDLPGGQRASLIDVPGHEDFVRTMAAGASGIDLMLLVVAADEGVMPQTREHLAIGEQLAVPRGIPVISKTDLAEPDWLDMVAEELVELLAESPIPWSSPVRTSAATGDGIAALQASLAAEAKLCRTRAADEPFRLPVDRAFSIAGAGTVITGTCWSGRIRPGQRVLLLPDGIESRVRAVEEHGEAAEVGRAGKRLALALTGVARNRVARGSTAVDPDAPWLATRAIDVSLRLLPGARPVEHRTRVRLLHGTREVMARVNLMSGALTPGVEASARLALEQPLVARGADKFVIRSYSPIATIGGGTVIDPQPPPRTRKIGGRAGSRWPSGLASPDPAARLAALIERRPEGLGLEELPIVLGETLPDDAGSDPWRKINDRLVSVRQVAALSRMATELVRSHHERSPSDFGLPLETLRSLLKSPPWLSDHVIGELVSGDLLHVADGTVRLPDFAPTVPGGAAAIDSIVDLIDQGGLMPQSVAELQQETGIAQVADILRLAAAAGRVEQVTADRYYGRQALDSFVATVERLGSAGPFAVSALRDQLGLSRKYLIPLLEWSDRRGLTVRSGDSRRLAGRPG